MFIKLYTSTKSNIFKIIARHIAFAYNILKRIIESFYQIEIFVFYKDICWGFIVNNNMIKVEIRKIV